MAAHNETGKKGEQLATDWLEAHGFNILHRNWCWYRYEVDVIAARDQVLHFIEVKTRRSYTFGFPEESVSRKKIRNLMQCAERYQYEYPQWKRIQYDILSINLVEGAEAEYLLIEDVYV